MTNELTDEMLDGMTPTQILQATQDIFIKETYKALRDGTVHPRDMSFVNQLLRNNDIKEETEEAETMHEKVLRELE